jgi:hypothetical protein
MEVPAYPMDHPRAMAVSASIMMLFNSAVILIFSFIYMAARSVTWEDVWVGDDWIEQRVVHWEWVLAGIFMMAASGTGVAGGIAAARSTRYTLAMLAAVMLLGATLILQLDWYRFTDEGYGQLVFILVLAVLPMVFLFIGKPSFRDPPPKPGVATGPSDTDNYGWSRLPGAGRGQGGGPTGGGG